MTAKSASLLLFLLAFLLLTACGGGGGGSSFTETPELSPSSSVAAGPGTEPKVAAVAGPGTSEPIVERQQTAEEQRIFAQRQREREENDAAWRRYLDTLEPEIRAEQEAKRLQRLLKCQGEGCVDSFLASSPEVTFTGFEFGDIFLFTRVVQRGQSALL